MISRARRRIFTPATLALLLAASTFIATGCRSGEPKQDVWPQVEVLPGKPPAQLDKAAATSVLRRGPDGFVYIVGGLDERAKPGATFLARYSGEWPLDEVPRPPMAAGQIMRRYGDDVALVQMLYSFPDTELESLEITWQDDIAREDIGKGVGKIEEVIGEPEFPKDLTLSLGRNLGVQLGDIYAVVKPSKGDTSQNHLQLGRRLSAICLVQKVEDNRSVCRIWHGSMLHPRPAVVTQGDTALFMEHTFGAPPRQALLQFAKIKGDADGSVRKHLMEQTEQYLNTHAAANITVESLDKEFDPTNPAFYKNEEEVEYRGMPQILVAGALIERDGREHLVINYTGIGPATGPGMVAAPPEFGIDMGRADKIGASELRHMCGLFTGAVFVYRGQTSEALMHLRQMLGDEKIQGELRWHLRDQYAMRWASLEHWSEALWLVLEDEEIATQRQDRQAVLNALGTRVRFYDELGLPDKALEQSARYLKMRQEDKAHPSAIMSAMGMHAEMLMSKGQITEAKSTLANLEKMCPDGCSGDLFAYISGVYWSVPQDNKALQDELLAKLESLAKKGDDAIASLRIYQGFHAMRDGQFEQALVAFLEAERLFDLKKSQPGVARAKYFAFLAQLGMKEPLKAYETASEALSLATDLRDYATAALIYDRLSSVYLSLDLNQAPGNYIRVASKILISVYESQVATGDLGKSSETLFTIGTLFFKLGSLDEATTVITKAVIYSIRATRFDIAAMSHLTLGLIARARGDAEGFRNEIQRAELMGRLSGNPVVLEAIQRALEPAPARPETPPDGSQVL